MADRHPVPLHVADPQRRRVEQQVDQVVRQQVDLVHVEHAAVGRLASRPRLVGLDALGQGTLDVQRARAAGPRSPPRAARPAPGRPGPRRAPASPRGASLGRLTSGRLTSGRLTSGRLTSGRLTSSGFVRPRPGSPGPGSAGMSQENRQPATTSTSGRTAASARTIVDFAVPFSPRTRTPPTAGDTALSTKASRRSSRPTTAVKGNPPRGHGFDHSFPVPFQLAFEFQVGRRPAAGPGPRPGVRPTGPGRPPRPAARRCPATPTGWTSA